MSHCAHWRRHACRAAVLALLACVPTLWSQEPLPKSDIPIQTVPVPPGNGEVIYLRDLNGRPVPVAASATVKKFLQWLDEQNAGAGAVPDFGISGVSIEGTADDDRARLTIQIKVQVHHDRWVKVPLGLSEAYLLPDHQYQGSGEQQVGELDPKTGYTWWLKGGGEHVLTLPVKVPLRKVPLGRRLFLTLPTTAISALKLTLPATASVTPAMERATVQVQPRAKETDVEAFGLGERLDVAWQPQPEAAPATVSLDTQTSLLATIVDGQTLSLNATLTIKALRGNLDQLRIQLPAGFAAPDPSRSALLIDGEEAPEIRTDDADPSTLIVPLKRAVNGVEVTWRGTQRLPAAGAIAIEGPRVDHTDLHAGFLAVAVGGDYVARPVFEAEPTVERISPSSLPPALTQAHVSAAYRILRQPFRLPLTLHKVEPVASVEPQAWLHAAGSSLDLDMSWKVQVHRGSLTSLQINWPGRDPGWVLDPLEPAPLIQSVDESPEGLTVHFVAPTSEPFLLRLKARHPIGAEGRLPVHLPQLATHRSTATEVLLTTADNLQSRVMNAEGQPLSPLPAATPLRRTPPPESLKFAGGQFRFEPGASRLELELQPHAREISGRSIARLSVGRGRLLVTQVFQLDVRYERLAKLRFAVPASLPGDQVRFFLGNAELVPARDIADSALVVSLDSPRLGAVEIEARYRLADPLSQPGISSAQLAIPLLRVADVALSETRMEWLGTAYMLDTVASGWTRQTSAESAAAWSASGSPSSVDVKLTPSANPSVRGAVASRALLQTRLSSEGRMLCTARYRVSGLIPNLRWSLPAGAEGSLRVWWNKDPVIPTVRRQGTEIVCELLGAEAPLRSSGDDHLLTIAWHLGGPALTTLSNVHLLSAPRLVNLDVTETLWQVEVPSSHYLMKDPRGFDPQHVWQFSGWAWHRTPRRSTPELGEWIRAADGPDLSEAAGYANRYQFSRLGDAESLSLWTMTGAGIVLLGTGVFAAAGLVLLQSSRTRNLMTVVVCAVALAGLGVVFPSTAQVLLQPAAVGLLLAVSFSLVQHVLKRRRPDPMAMASGSSYPIPAGSSIRQAAPVIGSDENTMIRSGSKDKTPVPTETGSRA